MSSLRTIERVEDSPDSQGVRGRTARRPRDGGALKPRQNQLPDSVTSQMGHKSNSDSPVEGAGGTEGVGAHFAPCEPVADFHALGQSDDLPDAVDRVARRAPNGRLLSLLVSELDGEVDGERDVWRWWESGSGSSELRADGEGVRVDDLVVKHDAVERAVYAIVDVVCDLSAKVYAGGSGQWLDARNVHMTSAPSPSSCCSADGAEASSARR